MLALPGVLPGQTVRQIPDKKLFVMDTSSTTYAVGVNRLGILQHVYWGKKVRAEDLSQPVPVPERSSFDSSETQARPKSTPPGADCAITSPRSRRRSTTAIAMSC